jgi:hypothetical protein
MTKTDIIQRGEEQLQYTYNRTQNKDLERPELISIAEKGLAQLDMLYYILGEDENEWVQENYRYWFDKFYNKTVYVPNGDLENL